MKKFVFGLLALFLLSGQLAAMGRRPEHIPEPATPQQARESIVETAEEEGWSNRNRQRAIEVLGILDEEGVPVETGLGAVIAAGDNRERQDQLTEPGKVSELRQDGSRNMVNREARSQGWNRGDRETAINVLDQLIEEGIPVETARTAVLNSMTEHRSASQTQRLLRTERVEELKRERMEGRERGLDRDDPARDPERSPSGR